MNPINPIITHPVILPPLAKRESDSNSEKFRNFIRLNSRLDLSIDQIDRIISEGRFLEFLDLGLESAADAMQAEFFKEKTHPLRKKMSNDFINLCIQCEKIFNVFIFDDDGAACTRSATPDGMPKYHKFLNYQILHELVLKIFETLQEEDLKSFVEGRIFRIQNRDCIVKLIDGKLSIHLFYKFVVKAGSVPEVTMKFFDINSATYKSFKLSSLQGDLKSQFLNEMDYFVEERNLRGLSNVALECQKLFQRCAFDPLGKATVKVNETQSAPDFLTYEWLRKVVLRIVKNYYSDHSIISTNGIDISFDEKISLAKVEKDPSTHIERIHIITGFTSYAKGGWALVDRVIHLPAFKTFVCKYGFPMTLETPSMQQGHHGEVEQSREIIRAEGAFLESAHERLGERASWLLEPPLLTFDVLIKHFNYHLTGIVLRNYDSDLESFIRKEGQALTERDCLAIAKKISQCHAYRIASGVVITDIKPGNMLLLCKDRQIIKMVASDPGRAYFEGETIKSFELLTKGFFGSQDLVTLAGMKNPIMYTSFLQNKIGAYAIAATCYFVASKGKMPYDDSHPHFNEEPLNKYPVAFTQLLKKQTDMNPFNRIHPLEFDRQLQAIDMGSGVDAELKIRKSLPKADSEPQAKPIKGRLLEPISHKYTFQRLKHYAVGGFASKMPITLKPLKDKPIIVRLKRRIDQKNKAVDKIKPTEKEKRWNWGARKATVLA
jgi:hypothetical protein